MGDTVLLGPLWEVAACRGAPAYVLLAVSQLSQLCAAAPGPGGKAQSGV